VIAAARQMARDDSLGDAVFILAGDAQGREAYRDELQRLIAASSLSDRVRIVGHCDDMPAAFGLAHVAIVASTSAETFGRTSIEAQASGCPVIVTDIGATPETLIPARPGSEDHTGWLVPAADPSVLTKAIAVALALPPAERERIGGRARAHVAAKFALRQMQQATLSVYDELLGTELARAFGMNVKDGQASAL
jgi:glycosyltransferase involved in cell wall biosynthesis